MTFCSGNKLVSEEAKLKYELLVNYSQLFKKRVNYSQTTPLSKPGRRYKYITIDIVCLFLKHVDICNPTTSLYLDRSQHASHFLICLIDFSIFKKFLVHISSFFSLTLDLIIALEYFTRSYQKLRIFIFILQSVRYPFKPMFIKLVTGVFHGNIFFVFVLFFVYFLDMCHYSDLSSIMSGVN